MTSTITSSDDETSVVPRALDASISWSLDNLGSYLSEALTTQKRARAAATARPWIRGMLVYLQAMSREIESAQGVLIAAGLNMDMSREDLARQIGETASDIARFETQWTKEEVGGIFGKDFCDIEKFDVDLYWANRTGAVASEQADYYLNRADRLLELLALLHTNRHEADDCSWLTEKTRRAIKAGWYVQAKAAGVGKKRSLAPVTETSATASSDAKAESAA
ncbi:hypothetical protein [Streptomyces geranii]|uniref:hypothetical protein n=1 Tax=Streptomyces geranii TaxID=2058923 RepID=UPI0013007B5A|nr:hypothetical protein [Streptomyces geranii]